MPTSKKKTRDPVKDANRIARLREASIRRAAERAANRLEPVSLANEHLFDFTMDNVEVERHA